MKTVSRRILTAFILASLGGTLLHFVCDLLPNPITALISPINESLWEHLKIIFWPFLTASLILTRDGEKGCITPWLYSLVTICAVMLGVGYWYHIIIGGENMIFDIGLYFVLMGAGFLLPRLFWPLGEHRWGRSAALILTVALGGAIVLFTFRTPAGVLFADLSAVRTWLTIPY